jgi:hypothetical protein
MALLFERIPEQLRHLLFILSDQHPHWNSLSFYYVQFNLKFR